MACRQPAKEPAHAATEMHRLAARFPACPAAESGLRASQTQDLRCASPLQSGAQSVLSAGKGARGLPPQRGRRHHCQQSAQQRHARTGDGEGSRVAGGAFHSPLPHPCRRYGLVDRPQHLRVDRERISARLFSRHRRIPHLWRSCCPPAGQKSGRICRRAEPLYSCPLR